MGNSSKSHRYLVCGNCCSRPERLVYSKNLKRALLALKLSGAPQCPRVPENILEVHQALYDLAALILQTHPSHWKLSLGSAASVSGSLRMYLVPLLFFLTSPLPFTLEIQVDCTVSPPFPPPCSVH